MMPLQTALLIVCIGYVDALVLSVDGVPHIRSRAPKQNPNTYPDPQGTPNASWSTITSRSPLVSLISSASDTHYPLHATSEHPACSDTRILHGCRLYGTTSSHDARCPFSGPFHLQPAEHSCAVFGSTSALGAYRPSNQSYEPVSSSQQYTSEQAYVGGPTWGSVTLSPEPGPADLPWLSERRTLTHADDLAVVHPPSSHGLVFGDIQRCDKDGGYARER